MPGYNQRGPMNEGPMTGRRLGRCAATTATGVGSPDTGVDSFGYGRGRGMAMGRGRCRRTWWNMDAPGNVQFSGPTEPSREQSLERKVQALESELAVLKNELRALHGE